MVTTFKIHHQTITHFYNNSFFRRKMSSTSINIPGLRLTLFVSQDDFIGMLAPEAGVRITVHSPWNHPFPNDKGVSAGTGLKTLIGTRLVGIYMLFAFISLKRFVLITILVYMYLLE